MDHKDEYHYRISREEIRPVKTLYWKRLDDKPEYSVLETISKTEPKAAKNFSIDSFFTDKIDQDGFKLGLLTHQIDERENLKKKHLEEIDETLIYCHTKINALEKFYFGRHKGIDRTRDQLSQQVLNLEQQKRLEESTAWKDQTMVLKDFLEAWNGYRADLWTYSVLNPERSNRSDSLK